MSKWIGPLVAVILMAVAAYFLAPAAEEAPAEDEPAAEDIAVSDGAACPAPTFVGTGSKHAALLVTFGNGRSRAFCVAFDGETLGADELLSATELDTVFQDFGGALGAALCKITDGDGASDGCDYPSESCFCAGPDTFWNLFGAAPGSDAWQRWEKGLAASRVGGGGSQALIWGGEGDGPPPCFYDDLCTQSE